MFSFHKPKVYRSTQGCCICKAKSSSSRFTDSKRYEIDFIECFQLEVPRQGEICNACVLLVKRFKRLPPGSERHWGHVVDARVGPGLKSMTKFKKRCEENGGRASPTENIKRLKQEVAAKHAAADAAALLANPNAGAGSAATCTSSFVPQKFRKIFRKTKKKKPTECHDENMLRLLDNGFVQKEIKALEEQMRIDDGWTLKQRRPKMTSRRRKDYVPRKNSGRVEGVLGDSVAGDWRQLKTCCGYVMENRELSALMVDLSMMRVCPEHKQRVAVPVEERKWQQPQGVTMQPTTGALKKHQLYLNRALLSGDLQYANTIPAALTGCVEMKTEEDEVVTVLDLSEKLVKRVAESNKFSDNSSDSGYEELSVPETTPVAIAPVEATIDMKKVVMASGYPMPGYKRSPHAKNVLYARKAAATGN